MQRLEVSGAVRPIYGSLGVKRLKRNPAAFYAFNCTHIYVAATSVLTPFLSIKII